MSPETDGAEPVCPRPPALRHEKRMARRPREMPEPSLLADLIETLCPCARVLQKQDTLLDAALTVAHALLKLCRWFLGGRPK